MNKPGTSVSREPFTMNKGNKKSPRVAVIGAGFSGLRCAEILGKSGARVTIFEAKDRVGGRVWLCCPRMSMSMILTLIVAGCTERDRGAFD